MNALSSFNIMFPNYVRAIISRLTAEGYDAYAIGGCVRDSILGRTPRDWDITTEAVPDEVIGIFAEGDIHVIGTAGVRHGTVMVKAGDDVCEITTFRCDGDYNDHRRPDSVTFSKTVEEDLARRDFTMNAIAAKPDGEGVVIKDPFGGAADIGSKIIRTVGDPEARFFEDALRIMRAVRFSAELGFSVEHNTAEAAIRLRNTLEYVSAERITSELWRALSAPFIADVVEPFGEIFDWIAPSGLSARFAKHIGDVTDPYVRLALMLDHCSDGTEFFRRLRFPNEVRHLVTRLLDLRELPRNRRDVCILMRKHESNLPTVAEYMRVLSDDGVVADGLAGDALLAEAEAVKADGVPYLLSHLEVRGGDIITAGVKDTLVGECLEYLLCEVQEGRVSNEKEQLLSAVLTKYITE